MSTDVLAPSPSVQPQATGPAGSTGDGRTARPARIAAFDPRGCPVATRSQTAIDHLEAATFALAAFRGDPIAELDAAIAADPSWALPHLVKANAMMATTEGAYAPMARACLDMAVALASTDARERGHIAATRALVAGRWLQACELWERILVDEPQDILALLFAHAFDFFRGDSVNLRQRVARTVPEWSREAPLFGFVLGMLAFGLEENQLYGDALDAGHGALELDRRDAWAVHAVAHVHEMRGEHGRGATWLQARADDWAPAQGLALHNWWHLALFQIEAGRLDAALEIYDERMGPVAANAMQHVDTAAMLWRLRLLGVEGLESRFAAAADAWPLEGDAQVGGWTAFNDLHAALAHVGAGRRESLVPLLASVEARAELGATTTQGAMARDIGMPLIRAVLAYADGRFDDAVELLLPLRETVQSFGGSHAQRDLVTLTLVDAAIQSGRRRLARHLLRERALFKADTAHTAAWLRRAG